MSGLVRKPMSDISNRLSNARPASDTIQDSINTPKKKSLPALDRVSLIREVSLSNLVEEKDQGLIIESLVQDLQTKWHELEKSDDSATRFFMSLLNMMDQHEEYKQGIRRGCPIICELIRSEFLPHFQNCKKVNYVDLVCCVVETLYQNLDAPILQEQRLNAFIRMSPGKASIAHDAECEFINLLAKRQHNVSMETTIRNSNYLALMQVSYKIHEDLTGNTVGAYKDSSKVADSLNREIVTHLFESAKFLDNRGRKTVDPRILWTHVGSSKAKFAVEAKKGHATSATISKQQSAEVDNLFFWSNEEVLEEQEKYEEGNPENDNDTNQEEQEEQVSNPKPRYPIHPMAGKDLIEIGKRKLHDLPKKRKAKKRREAAF
jgi:hypothetical protein